MQATYLILDSSNIKRDGEFYALFLGAKPKKEKARWIEFDAGEITLALQEKNASRPSSDSTLALFCSDLEKEIERLALNQIHPQQEPRVINEDDGSKVRWFVFCDPSGHQIGLYGT